MISDPDYCRCGATVRHGLELGTLSIYVPPTSPKHGHRHEWQKERTTTARHAKDPAFTLFCAGGPARNPRELADLVRNLAGIPR